jgi:hypothetical protein
MTFDSITNIHAGTATEIKRAKAALAAGKTGGPVL